MIQYDETKAMHSLIHRSRTTTSIMLTKDTPTSKNAVSATDRNLKKIFYCIFNVTVFQIVYYEYDYNAVCHKKFYNNLFIGI